MRIGPEVVHDVYPFHGESRCTTTHNMRRRHGVVPDFPLYAGVQCSSQYWFINIQGGLLRDIGAIIRAAYGLEMPLFACTC